MGKANAVNSCAHRDIVCPLPVCLIVVTIFNHLIVTTPLLLDPPILDHFPNRLKCLLNGHFGHTLQPLSLLFVLLAPFLHMG